jgi:ArsR family transcriptional regulator
VNGPWDILKTLSDPTRVRLLALLSREELSVAELQEILAMGQSRISSQLALLRSANLVTDPGPRGGGVGRGHRVRADAGGPG